MTPKAAEKANGQAGPMALELIDKARRAKRGRWKGNGRLPAAGQVAPLGGVERTEFFARLSVPMESGTGKPEKVAK